MRKELYVVMLVVVLLIVGVALGMYKKTETPTSSSTASSTGKIQVTASFYPLSFFAQQIGGTHAKVTNITPAGAEPHDYEPTPDDLITISQSTLLILNGNGLEPWGDAIRKNLATTTNLIIAGEGLANQTLTEGGERVTDPHVWLSPPLAKEMATTILNAFLTADPSHAADYEINAKLLISTLDELDRAYREGLATCKRTDIITSHAAFGYLAKAYHLHQVPIAGLSPDAEPSPKELADITQFAKKNTVTYIFFEALASPKLSETIAKEVGAQTLVLDPIEGISKADADQGKDYFSVMRANLKNLKVALSCR